MTKKEWIKFTPTFLKLDRFSALKRFCTIAKRSSLHLLLVSFYTIGCRKKYWIKITIPFCKLDRFIVLRKIVYNIKMVHLTERVILLLKSFI
jgi:hypothetical protein